MADEESTGRDSPEARRIRILRRAAGFGDSATRFARYLGWEPTALGNYENGFRRVPRDAALLLYRKIPGFDPIWLWTGEKRGLGFDLSQRIEAAEAEEEECEQRQNRTGQP